MTSSHAAALVEEVLSGEQDELKFLAAQGLLPLPAASLLELQITLAEDENSSVAASALESLRSADPQFLMQYIVETEDLDALIFFARHSENVQVLEQVIRRRTLPGSALSELAVRAAPEVQELLLQRQDLIVEQPEILDQLSLNPRLSPYSSRRVAEYREHLIARPKAPSEPEPEESDEPLELVTEEELAEEISEVREVEAKGEKDESTGLSESQIRALSMGARMRLTRGAQKTMRSILVRDSNPIVAVSVMQNSPITEGEVEKIAGNRTVAIEVLEEVGRRRDWMRKYNVVHNLVRNPRSPVGLSVRQVPRLSVRDLSKLAKDRNVPDAVRKAADRLYRMKTS